MYVEVVCDECGEVEFPPNGIDPVMEIDGWKTIKDHPWYHFGLPRYRNLCPDCFEEETGGC